MKKILEFNMPDDENEFNHANNGEDYYIVLFNIIELLVKKINSDEKAELKLSIDIYQEILDFVNRDLEYRNLVI